nr:dethiobiotin synthase [Pseudomonas sp.]
NENPYSSSINWEASQTSCVVFGQSAGTASAATALLRALTDSGLRTVGMMPVSTGDGPDRNALEALSAAGAFALPSAAICPYVFEEEGAAAVLARQRGITLGLEDMVDTYQALATWSDGVVVAAPGDVQRPLGNTFCLCDLAKALHLPAVLVVDGEGRGPRDACATARALRARSVPLAGWVAIASSHTGVSVFNDCVTRNLTASLLGTLIRSPAGQENGYVLEPADLLPGYQAHFDVTAVLAALRGPWP